MASASRHQTADSARRRRQEFKLPFDLRAEAIGAGGQQVVNRNRAGRCHGVDGFDAPILAGKVYFEAPSIRVMLIVGKPGTAMPSWKGRLPDDDLCKIIAYVSSLGGSGKGCDREVATR